MNKDFRKALPLFYEDTGLTDYTLYEYDLGE